MKTLRRCFSSFRKWSNSGCNSPINFLIVASPYEAKLSEVWNPLLLKLLKHGHEVALLNLFVEEKESLPQRLLRLQHATASMGPQTIIIAASVSGFIAQKYLESHSSKGLMLINSYPPDIRSLVARLLERPQETHRDPITLAELQGDNRYRGVFQGLFAGSETPFYINPELLLKEGTILQLQPNIVSTSAELLHEMVDHPVNLEEQSVPIEFLFSAEDKLLTEDNKKELVTFHGYSWESDVKKLEKGSHLFWLNDSDIVDSLGDHALNFAGNF